MRLIFKLLLIFIFIFIIILILNNNNSIAIVNYKLGSSVKNNLIDSKYIIKRFTIKDKKYTTYNPSIIYHNNSFYFIMRSYKKMNLWSYNKYCNNRKDIFKMVSLIEKRDINMNLEKKMFLTFDNKIVEKFKTTRQHIEDIRIMHIKNDKLYISYTVNLPKEKIGIGYIDLNMIDQKITHLNIITKSNGKEITHPEKNWQIINNPCKEVLNILSKYNYDEDKHLLMHTYATSLWIVSIIDVEEGNKIDIPEFTYNLGEKLVEINFPKISQFGKEKVEENLRCTTSLEIINEQYYITILHTHKPYIAVFCLVDIKTLEPKFIYGPKKFKNFRCIEYPSSIKVVEDTIYLGLGIGDTESEIISIDKNILLNEMLKNNL